MLGKFGRNAKANFRETTFLTQWRHNVSDQESYTELDGARDVLTKFEP